MRTWLCLVTLLWPCFIETGFSATLDLGHGFADHGVATPESMPRGIVATVDGRQHPVILCWLMDHRECYELLLIDVLTGKAEEFPLPFPPGDSPFASILSRSNKFYTHCGGYFVEFDPAPGLHLLPQDRAADGDEHDGRRSGADLVGNLSPQRRRQLQSQQPPATRLRLRL